MKLFTVAWLSLVQKYSILTGRISSFYFGSICVSDFLGTINTSLSGIQFVCKLNYDVFDSLSWTQKNEYPFQCALEPIQCDFWRFKRTFFFFFLFRLVTISCIVILARHGMLTIIFDCRSYRTVPLRSFLHLSKINRFRRTQYWYNFEVQCLK